MKALKKLFSGIAPKKYDPEHRAVYAVTGGTYLGEFLVYIEKVDSDFMFLCLPKMEVKCIPYDKYILAIKGEVIEKVEDLPEDVYNVCVAQYRKNKEQQ